MIRERFAGDFPFNLFVHCFLAAVALFILLPLLISVMSSFSDPVEVASGSVTFWPVKPTLLAYQDVFETAVVWSGYANSLLVTMCGVALSLFLTAMAAYPLSRPDFLGGRLLLRLIVLSMLLGGGLIPFYLVVKSLGLVNRLGALVFPFLFNPFNLIVMTSFFRETVPGELVDAARVEGCGNFRFFLSIVLPLSGAVLSVVALYYGVGYWNDFFHALLFLNSRSKFTLPLVLRDILIAAEASLDPQGVGLTKNMYRAFGMRFALIWVASLPLVVLYPALQRYFVKGVMLGAIKA